MSPKPPPSARSVALCLGILLLAAVSSFGEDGPSARRRFREGIGRLIQKVRTEPAPTAKGIPFPTVPGPKCKSDRIGIVGAGPAGIHMAYLLKKEGFTDVTVLEQSNRIGGKSINVGYRNVTYNLSTYLLTPDYRENLLALMQEFGLADGIRRWEPHYRMEADHRSPALTPTDLAMGMAATPEELLGQAERYVDLHRDLFGVYDGELMRRPRPEVMERIRGSFADFLKRNNLTALIPRFDLALRTAGYDLTSDMGAAQGLMYESPRLLVEGLLAGMVDHVTNDNGFNAVFEEMIKRQDIDIQFNYKVKYVRRLKDDRVQVFGDDHGQSDKFDFLIWSGLMRDFAKHSRVVEGDAEKRILKSNQPVNVAGSLVNVRGDRRRAYAEGVLKVLLAPFDNNVAGSDDNLAEVKLPDKTAYASGDYEIDGEPVIERTYVILQYGSFRTPSEKELRDKIQTYFREGFEATDVEILTTVPWKYFPHWDIEEVNEGYHWDLFEMQGKYNMWFIGGGASFDTVKSVMEYNKLLLRQARPVEVCEKDNEVNADDDSKLDYPTPIVPHTQQQQQQRPPQPQQQQQQKYPSPVVPRTHQVQQQPQQQHYQENPRQQQEQQPQAQQRPSFPHPPSSSFNGFQRVQQQQQHHYQQINQHGFGSGNYFYNSQHPIFKG